MSDPNLTLLKQSQPTQPFLHFPILDMYLSLIDHFKIQLYAISGRPADLNATTDPDWAPTQNLGHSTNTHGPTTEPATLP